MDFCQVLKVKLDDSTKTSHIARNLSSGLATSSNTNHAVQAQKMV